ncbi:Protein TolB [Candidatus Thermoflexus japonica]|uniref:Protein TolB n=1 Tax=Candidatus Thermoflexus japonica TaxID=2035417 RepID=A0A2H5Y5T8_9CHLR|nr:Protein TolB [Candidatus Thermoflexus japonica]
MLKKSFLFLALFTYFLLGCGTFNVSGRLVRPDEATATAQAVRSPTPEPELGRLAYVQGGDVWAKDLPDGQPRRLTSDGRNREPRWSPSGRWLAFRKGDYQVWVMRADSGAAYPLNQGGTVGAFVWSPTEDRLAYVAPDGALVVASAGDGKEQQLVPGTGGQPYTGVVRFAWSPDGEWLAYEYIAVEQGAEQPMRRAGLWRIRADGREATQLLDAGTETYEPILAGWVSDGSALLYWEDPMYSASLLADGAMLWRLPLDGGPPQSLVATLAYEDFVVPHPLGTDWIAVVAGGGRESWLGKQLYIVRVTTGEQILLSPPDQVVASPAWLPDGRRLAYVAMPAAEGVAGGEPARQALMQRRIWLVDVESRQRHPLTDDPAYRDERPLWSADGSHILFARLDGQGRASLWLVSTEGDEPVRVVDELTPAPEGSGYYGHVEWDNLFDWWTGPPQPKETVHVPHVPPPAPVVTASPSAPATPTVVLSPTSTPPPPTLGPTRPYTDAALGIALDVPADWEVEGVSGAEAHFTVRDQAGNPSVMLDLLVLGPESRTLDRALAEVERGAWGRYLRAVEPVRLGAFEALRLTLTPGEGRPTTAWLVVTPSGRAVAFVPGEDAARVAAVLSTLRPAGDGSSPVQQ